MARATLRFGSESTRDSIRRAAILAASALGINAILGPAARADTTWTNSSGGSFATSGNWSNGVPNSTVNAWFNLGSVSGYTVTFPGSGASNNLEVDNDTLSLALGGNTLALTQNANVGGVLNSANANGNLTLGNGTLSAVNLNIADGGGTGVLTQQTGSIVDTTNLNIAGASGGTGTYDMSSGSLSVGTITASSGGTYTQSGGTVAVSSVASFAGASAFNFTGGTLRITAGSLNPLVTPTTYNEGSGTGSYNAWSVSGSSTPTLSLVGSTVTSTDQIAIIGNSGGSGTVFVGDPVAGGVDTEGVLSVSVALFIGVGGANSGSTYTPGNGTLDMGLQSELTAPTALIGSLGGQGTLSVTNGATASVSTIYIGDSDYTTTATGVQASSGSLTVSGGSGLISSDAYIGDGTATGKATLGVSGTTDLGSNWINSGAISVADTGTVDIYGGTTLSTNSLQNNGGSVILSGGTIIAGTLALTSGSGQGFVWNSGTVDITGSITNSASITVPSGGKLVFVQNTTAVTTLSALSITAGGTVNLNNNHIFIDYGSGVDPKTTILGYLSAGANGGAWNGSGINSAVAAGNSNYGVGFADSADGVDTSLSSGQIEIAYVQYGDITLSGLVNSNDFHILASNFGHVVTGGWEDGDFLYSGTVNAEDFSLLTANFGHTETGENVTMPSSEWAAIDAFAAANGLAVPSNVPEPAAAGLAVLAGAGALARRRRRSQPDLD